MYVTSEHFKLSVKYLDQECDNLEDCRAGVGSSICSRIEGLCICADGDQVYEHEGREYCYGSKAGDFCYFSDDCLCELI